MFSTASADVVQTVGDVDFFGFGTGTYGTDDISAIDVDNRDVGDPIFTDHDVRDSVLGPDSANDVSWTHDFSSIFPAATISGVTLELALAGIQDSIQDGVSFPEFDDRIFVEGIELANVLDNVNQGATGTGIFQFELSATQIASFSIDGILNVEFDGGRRNSDGALESYFIDYSRVIVSVPEPGSTTLVGLIATAGVLRRRRKN